MAEDRSRYERVFDAATHIQHERAGSLGNIDSGATALGRAWGAVLSEHLGRPIPDLPPHVVNLMMVALKTLRAARDVNGVFRFDDYVDGCNYLSFACEQARDRALKIVKEASADNGGKTSEGEHGNG